MEKKIGFVILHYYAYDMTVECVNNLLKLFSNDEIKIVIVDNGSKNNSGKKLFDLYSSENKVKVILNEKNLGFAQGNNIGYSYLINNFNLDFIIIMNNDVLIKDSDFLNKITDIYEDKKFAVLGPDIINPKLNIHQNPSYWYDSDYLYGRTYQFMLDRHNQLIEEYKHLRFHLFYEKYRKVRKICFHWLRKFIPNKKPGREFKKAPIDIEYQNAVLHGACYIFSKDFMQKRNEYAFNPNTFLYCEEDILHLECKRDNLLLLYSPKIVVYHLEDVSTNSVFKKKFDKEKMVMENSIKSTQVFLDVFNNTSSK